MFAAGKLPPDVNIPASRSERPADAASLSSAVCETPAGAGGRQRAPLGSPDFHQHQGAGQALRPHLRGLDQVPRMRRHDSQVDKRPRMLRTNLLSGFVFF